MVTRDDCSFTESVYQKSTVGLGAQKLLDNHINDISYKPLDMDGKRQLSFWSHWPSFCFPLQTPGRLVGKLSHSSSLAGPYLRESKDRLAT